MQLNLKKPLTLICGFISLSVSSTVLAQSNDELIKQYILTVCNDVINNGSPAQLLEVCLSQQGPGPHVGNAGSIGALGTTSAGVASLIQRATKKREKEKEKEQEQEQKDNNQQTGSGASADDQAGKLSMFANLAHLDGKRDTTLKENGFDMAQNGITVGADYRHNNNWFSGAAINVNKTKNSLYNSSGKLDSNSYALILYSSYFIGDNLAVDGYASAAKFSYDSVRHITFGPLIADADASYDGRQFAVGTSGSYSYSISSLTLGGIAKFDYNSTDIDAYSENNGGGLNFSFQKQSIESLTTKFGIQAGYALSFSWGVLQPQARLNYVHEFSNDSRTIGTALVLGPQYPPLYLTTDKPDRDYFLSGIGTSTVSPNGLQTFIDVEFLSGHSYLSTWTATIGMRWEF